MTLEYQEILGEARPEVLLRMKYAASLGWWMISSALAAYRFGREEEVTTLVAREWHIAAQYERRCLTSGKGTACPFLALDLSAMVRIFGRSLDVC